MDHLFKEVENVSAAQIVQNEIGKILIRIVKTQNYSEKDENQLKNELRQRFAKRLKYKIEYCEKVEIGKNGKQRFVINKLSSFDRQK